MRQVALSFFIIGYLAGLAGAIVFVFAWSYRPGGPRSWDRT